MNSKLINYGASSLIIGEFYYKKFIKKEKIIKNNVLLKITRLDENHHETKYLDIIREINNYEDYYSIPEKESFILESKDPFYIYLDELVKRHNFDIDIFQNDLTYYFIDYAGNQDLLESLQDLMDYKLTIWNSYKSILKFTKQMLEGLDFLHQKKICHLDIKPENIMINTYTKKFKIIDFGYSTMEPFDDYISNIRGTPGYFPKCMKEIDGSEYTEWLPKIEANDMTFKDGRLLIDLDRKLVYLIDSYCLGRVLYFLKYVFKDNYVSNCCFTKNTNEKKLTNIINNLTENDIYKRYSINKCLINYFR